MKENYKNNSLMILRFLLSCCSFMSLTACASQVNAFDKVLQYVQIQCCQTFMTDIARNESYALSFYKNNTSESFSLQQNIDSLLNMLGSEDLIKIGYSAWDTAILANAKMRKLLQKKNVWDILKNPETKKLISFPAGQQCAAFYLANWLKIVGDGLWNSPDKKLFYQCWSECLKNYLLV